MRSASSSRLLVFLLAAGLLLLTGFGYQTVGSAAPPPAPLAQTTASPVPSPTVLPAAATASAATEAYWTQIEAANAAAAAAAARPTPAPGEQAPAPGLWQVYDNALKGAKYIDLTHTLNPSIPVWAGFGPAKFMPTIDPTTGKPYLYSEGLGFEATAYNLTTDQYGTQLDPPAHWAPEYPAIDELPATYAVRRWW